VFLSLWAVCFCLQGDCANCIHAVIKYNASDASFTLHDINSVLGVYVNDCRVHNSAVMLEHNDIIRFGYTGIAYEFLLECQPKVVHIYSLVVVVVVDVRRRRPSAFCKPYQLGLGSWHWSDKWIVLKTHQWQLAARIYTVQRLAETADTVLFNTITSHQNHSFLIPYPTPIQTKSVFTAQTWTSFQLPLINTIVFKSTVINRCLLQVA